MEKIVILYTSYDGELDYHDEYVLFEYTSKEDAYVDFASAVEEAIKENLHTFTFKNRVFSRHDFQIRNNKNELEFYCDGFYTLEEWFHVNKLK